jgi:acyl-CoA thioesterase-1
MIRRRLTILAALALFASPARGGGSPPVVTILGDSITAGLGLPAEDALPARLQAILRKQGVVATVRGAGVSGDTTAGGLARVDFSVLPDTRVCVVELGANDYFQAVSPMDIRANLLAVIARLKARGVRVVLAAGQAPKGGSGPYGRAFDAVFPEVARKAGVVLAPNLLKGVLDHPGMRQADGVHPNAAGAAVLAERLAPYVARALAVPRRG